ALDQVLEAHAPLELAEDRHVVRVPRAQAVAHLHLLAVLDLEHAAHGRRVAIELAAALVDEQDLPVAVEYDGLAVAVDHRAHVVEAHDALALGAHLGFLDGAARRAADVERAHRELRSRLADRLRGDDADRQATLGNRAAREVHAVAT